MPNEQVIRAYRQLYRAGLRAVQYSKPARFVLRDQLREAFRERGAPALEPERVRRTVWFLNAAAQERGLEHRIVRSLLRTAWERRGKGAVSWKMVQMGMKARDKGVAHPVEASAFQHYDMTVEMLNSSMGLCLR